MMKGFPFRNGMGGLFGVRGSGLIISRWDFSVGRVDLEKRGRAAHFKRSTGKVSKVRRILGKGGERWEREPVERVLVCP